MKADTVLKRLHDTFGQSGIMSIDLNRRTKRNVQYQIHVIVDSVLREVGKDLIAEGKNTYQDQIELQNRLLEIVLYQRMELQQKNKQLKIENKTLMDNLDTHMFVGKGENK